MNPKRTPTCYSYIRFSSSLQSDGDSLRRQMSMSEAWATQHGMTLDKSLRFHDLGIPSYRSQNRQHALGEFLLAIEQGRVKKGDHLLVESVDRLSRDKPWEAFKLFQTIIDKGITVVTLMDGLEYSLKTINENEGHIFILFATMQRAHNESSTKSNRSKESWKNKRTLAEQGIKSKHICPAWLKWDASKKKYVPIPERVKIIKRIFKMAIQGHGHRVIADALNKEGIPSIGRKKKWQISFIQKILVCRTVLGERSFTIKETQDGKSSIQSIGKVIPDYYPQIIAEKDWLLVKARRDRLGYGGNRKGKTTSNLFTKMVFCAKCESTMIYTQTQNRRKAIYFYLSCSGKRREVGRCKSLQVRYDGPDGFEQTILTFIQDHINYDTLQADQTVDTELQSVADQIEIFKAKHKENNVKNRNLLSSISNYSGKKQAAYQRLIMEEIDSLLEQNEKISNHVQQLEQRYAQLAEMKSNSRIDLDSLKKLIKQMSNTDKPDKTDDIRRRLRNQLLSLIEKIDIDPDSKTTTILFKSGKMRIVVGTKAKLDKMPKVKTTNKTFKELGKVEVGHKHLVKK